MNIQQDSNSDVWMEGDEPQGQGSGQAVNPLLLVHRALRGRYALALIVGITLAIPGALVGHRLVPPVYTSEGIVTIDPTRPVLLYENEFNEAITAFESFVRSQARLLESPLVMQEAAKKLQEEGALSTSASNWARIQGATEVIVPRGSRDMIVRVTMTDRTLAQQTARAILVSYETFANEEARLVFGDRVLALETVRRDALDDRNENLALARQKSEEMDIVDLERRRVFVQEQIEALDRQIQALQIEAPALQAPSQRLEGQQDDEASQDEVQGEIEQADATRTDPQGGEVSAEGEPNVPELTAEDLAMIDADLNALVSQRRSLQQQLTALLARVTKRHPDYLAVEDELKSVLELIESRRSELLASGIGKVGAGAFGGLNQRLEAIQAIREKYVRESKELSQVALDIEAYNNAAAAAQARLELADRRLESLQTEIRESREGRARISQQAEVPFGPSKDRRKQLAAMGAVGGFGASVAGFVAFGLFRPRYRYVADLEDEAASPPVLGLVPQVQDGRIEGDEAARAGVHQIRSLLESMPQSGGGRVVVITSATAAEGKSTLAAALAASMAMAGRHTLLIDADLIGRGVTSRLSARQLSGLSDLVANRDTSEEGYVHEVEGRKNLDLMPAGVAEGFEPEQLSAQAMQELVLRMRRRYDAVVIDTGPILGSLEANAAAPQADQVVLVVSRGQNTRLVKLAIDRLRRFSVARIGLVFNRAGRADIERSTSAASVSIRSRAASRPADEQSPPISASA
ncbi:MAG: AAA family ATPase [Phycisphaerales bacterium]